MKNIRDFIPPGADVQMASDAIRAEVAKGGAFFFEPMDYTILGSLRPPSGTLLMGGGYGARIMCPDVGWDLGAGTDNFGLVNVKNANDVRISGVRLYGTKNADQTHTPKLVYAETIDGLTIDHCAIEHTAWEAIWCGGARQTNRGIVVEVNQVRDAGFPSSYVGLAAITLNAQECTVTGNRMSNLGVGISVSGTRCTVTANEIKECTLQGISTGDGGECGIVTITGNTVELASSSVVVGGIVIGGSGPSYSNNVSGNIVRLRGGVGVMGRCYRYTGPGSGAHFVGNTAEIDGVGTGFECYGSANGEAVTFSENRVVVTNESGTCFGFSGVPNGAGKSLVIASSGGKVFGMTRAHGSFAYDYNANGGGALTALMMNDVMAQGNMRIGGSYYGAGQFDFAPINLSAVNYVHP